MPIRKEVEKAWQALFQTVTIGSNPNAFVMLTPQKVWLQGLTFDDKDHLVVRFAVDGSVQTAVVNQAPSRPKSAPLPDLVQSPAVDPKFHVLLPVGVELSAINPNLSALVAGSRIELDADSFAVVKKASLYAKDGSLYARLNVEAEHRKLRERVAGTVFLKCGVAVSAGPPVLRLTNIKFDVQTENVLAGAAVWLLNDAICRRVEDRVRIDLGGPLEKLRGEVNSRYAELGVGPDFTLKPQLEKVTFEGVQIRDNFIIVGFDLSGEVSGGAPVKK